MRILSGVQPTGEVHLGNFFGYKRDLQGLADSVAYLQKDLPYRKIHDLTGVSVTTIGRVARCLSAGSGGYQTAIERLSH